MSRHADELGGELTDRLRRRLGRVAFGSVLLLGVLALIFECPAYLQERGARIPAALVIGVTWLLAAVAYLVAFHAPLAGTAHRARSRTTTRARNIDHLRMPSLVLPALGTVSLLPITFHMPIALAMGGSRGFDFWCGLSVFMAAAAQVTIGAFAVERVRAIAAGRTPRRLRTVYLVTVVAGLIPSIIGAAIVAITALPILGVLRELDRIATTEQQPDVIVPTAIARVTARRLP